MYKVMQPANNGGNDRDILWRMHMQVVIIVVGDNVVSSVVVDSATFNNERSKRWMINEIKGDANEIRAVTTNIPPIDVGGRISKRELTMVPIKTAIY